MKNTAYNFLGRLTIFAIVAAAFGASCSVAFAAGIVTLTFDDGNATQYQTASTILKPANQKAVFFLNSGLMGTETYMTWEQVADLHANGFEIAGHTVNHVELPILAFDAMTFEIDQDYANFVAHGITPTNFASPFGAYDNVMMPIVARKYNSHRAFANQGLNTWPYNKYVLNVRYVTNQTSLDQVKAWVSEAVAQDAWLILVFHEILSVVDPTDDYSWETTKFQGFIDYLNLQGIQAKTIAETLVTDTNLIANPSFETGLTGWTTDSPTNVAVNTAHNGSYPNPTSSILITGGSNAGHLFGQKVSVLPSIVYGVRAYTDSRGLSAGEVGFYVDEYDQNGNWVSGKWLGGFINMNVTDKSYAYKPTSGSVHTAAVQLYMTSGAGSVYIDNVELFARTQTVVTNLIANPSFESGFTGWSTDKPASVTLDTARHGGSPLPTNSVKIIGSTESGHLFGGKIPVAVGSSYGLKAYTDSGGLTAGEVGFYVDEYDQVGNWISGKWIAGFTDRSAVSRSYVYQPTSSSVNTAGVQVYMTPGAGSVYIDNVELFVR